MALGSHWCIFLVFLMFVGHSTTLSDVEYQSYGVGESGQPPAGRQKRSSKDKGYADTCFSFGAGVSFQRTWRSLLKGARLIHKENNRVMLYQKPGSYDQAIYDFYSFDPSYVHMTDSGELYGKVGKSDIYLRGRGPESPDAFQALLIIPSKQDARDLGLDNDFRITKGIKYVSRA